MYMECLAKVRSKSYCSHLSSEVDIVEYQNTSRYIHWIRALTRYTSRTHVQNNIFVQRRRTRKSATRESIPVLTDQAIAGADAADGVVVSVQLPKVSAPPTGLFPALY